MLKDTIKQLIEARLNLSKSVNKLAVESSKENNIKMKAVLEAINAVNVLVEYLEVYNAKQEDAKKVEAASKGKSK